jgi:hypothetical protein
MGMEHYEPAYAPTLIAVGEEHREAGCTQVGVAGAHRRHAAVSSIEPNLKAGERMKSSRSQTSNIDDSRTHS